MLSEDGVWHTWTPAEEPIRAGPAGKAQCAWGSWYKGGDLNASMCLYDPGADHISDQIRKLGRWHDCDRLSNVWAHNTSTSSSLFLELGGNIGACSVEMLMRHREAALVIFEPSPLNLFRLSSTLHALALERPDLQVQDRVVVFPLAVGNASADLPLFVARNNHGDSVVGTTVPRQGRFRVAHTTEHYVHVRPLDTIFPSTSRAGRASLRGMIRLMKVGAASTHQSCCV